MKKQGLPKTEAVLAFDTSNYTTSVALMDLSGKLLDHRRRLLSVKDGERGLRQSDALFQHVRELPKLMEEMAPVLAEVTLKALGCSDSPRRVEGSYMPVFLAGESMARGLSASHGVPCYSFSHQEGHVAAGLWSLNLEAAEPFYVLHLSGGTTELLKVTPLSGPGSRNAPKGTLSHDSNDSEPLNRGSTGSETLNSAATGSTGSETLNQAATGSTGFVETILGATSDISLGQLIDRTGVALGLPFPAGPALEQLALGCEEKPFDIPFSIRKTTTSQHLQSTQEEPLHHKGKHTPPDLSEKVQGPGLTLSLSGPETFLQRLVKQQTASLDQSLKTSETTEFPDPLKSAVTHKSPASLAASPERIALSLFHFSGKLLGQLVKKAMEEHPLPMLLTVGGVASNAIVRKVMEEALAGVPLEIHHALPQFCSDNAVGTAALTVQAMISQHEL